MDIFLERTTPTLKVTFKDEDGNDVVPSSVTWRIDDESGVEIRGDTTITPSSATITLSLTENDTRIVSGKALEKRFLLITFTYGGNKTGRTLYVFGVRNLGAVT